MTCGRFLVVLYLLTAGPVVVASDPSSESPPSSDPAVVRRIESLEQEVTELRRLLAAATSSGEVTGLDAASFGARLDTLEATVDQLRQEIAAVSDDSAITTGAVEDLSESELRGAQLTVYGSIVAGDYDDAASYIDGEAIELVVSGRPHDRLGFFTEIEFERAAEVGGDRGGNVVVEQAYGTLAVTSWIGFKAGIILMPFGNYNQDHYSPTREVISRPLVSHTVVPSDWTDNGFGLVGRAGLGGGWVLDYEGYVVAGLAETVGDLDLRAARQPFGEDNNNNKAAIARLVFDRRGQLGAGFSYYVGDYDDDSRLSLTGWAGDLSAQLGPIRLAGEYNRFAVEQLDTPDAILEGYYVRGVYDLFRSWLRSGRHGEVFPEARLSLVAQYGQVELTPTADSPRPPSRESRWTLGLNYRPSHHWVLKVNHDKNEAAGDPILHGSSDAWLAAVGFVY